MTQENEMQKYELRRRRTRREYNPDEYGVHGEYSVSDTDSTSDGHEEETGETKDNSKKQDTIQNSIHINTQLEITDTNTNTFYLRYIIGHRDNVFGKEFLEFEIRSNGLLRYANESRYKRSRGIYKLVVLGPVLLNIIQRIIDSSKIQDASDTLWPEPSDTGYQKLEIRSANKHVSFVTSKLGTLLDISREKDPGGLQTFYYFVQDIKALVFSVMSLHYRIKPI